MLHWLVECEINASEISQEIIKFMPTSVHG